MAEFEVYPGQDKYICSGFHWSFGWLRRSDEDNEYGFCYEEPDGNFIHTDRLEHKDALYLDCYETAEGHRYHAFSRRIPEMSRHKPVKVCKK